MANSTVLPCSASLRIDAQKLRRPSTSIPVVGSSRTCGMLTFTDDAFKRAIQDETGIKPAWSAEAFSDLHEDVRQSVARIKASPFIPHKDAIRGFVFDVATGKLNEVS